MNEASTSASAEHSGDEKHVFLEQDRFLPIANISRLMKNVIPSTGKVAKDAKECVQESVSEFISFLTSEASERCFNERRKTITGEDLIAALSALGFDAYVEPMTIYVHKYREATRSERSLANSYPNQLSFTSGSNLSNKQTGMLSANSDSTVQNHSADVDNGSASAVTQQVVAQEVVTESLQQLQLLVDPETGQHYITVQDSDGKQKLVPVVLAESTVVMPSTTIQS